MLNIKFTLIMNAKQFSLHSMYNETSDLGFCTFILDSFKFVQQCRQFSIMIFIRIYSNYD